MTTDRRGVPWCTDTARAHLERVDPALAVTIGRVGACGLATRTRKPVFDSLVSAIVSQQLSTKAAATIHGRLLDAADGALSARWIAAAPDPVLRGAGLSGNKVLAVRDLSAHALDGRLPDDDALERMSDEAIVDALTDIRGIGAWTVHMLLIFGLGRPDVFAPGDLGLRKGIAAIDGLDRPPGPRASADRAAVWGPWRSAASWYLWRAAEGVGVPQD